MDDVSDGAKPLGLSSYFIRLTQLITSWMSLKTAHGRLYELDLRLRPDGNAGPLAISNERFLSYYDREAWIWEFFALRDARTVLNGSPFSKHLSAKLEILRSQRIKPAELSSAFAEIQDRRKGETYHFWNLKQRHGGLLDCLIALYIIGNLDKEYPAISNRLSQIQSRLEQLIQQLSTRLISYNSSTLPEQLIYFIAIQLGYDSDTLLKTQIDNDTNLISKILAILLHTKSEKNS
jgi:glutamine synthetase adenylyltransferase